MIMEKIYHPTNVDIDRCLTFATASVDSHYNNNRRTRDEIIEDIVVGKLGEIAFQSWFPGIGPPKLKPTKDPDPGWDLLRDNGDRIQVKTLNEGTKWVSFDNWNWDFIAAIRFIPNENCFRLLHINTKSTINGIAKKSKFGGWYYNP